MDGLHNYSCKCPVGYTGSNCITGNFLLAVLVGAILFILFGLISSSTGAAVFIRMPGGCSLFYPSVYLFISLIVFKYEKFISLAEDCSHMFTRLYLYVVYTELR